MSEPLASTPTIIFDFDGTLALGTGPLDAYARAIVDRTGDDDFLARARTALVAYEAGEAGYRDGYDAVATLAATDGVADGILSAAYDASRELLGTADAAVTAPEGLDRFLADVRSRARLIVATNAPGDSVTTVLRAWGVIDAFDELHFRVGKPTGLEPILRDALARGPVLSIGDIVEFDLAPAGALGADTALVGPAASRSDVAVTMRGRTIADLYDRIADWASSGASDPFRPPTSRTTLTSERQY